MTPDAFFLESIGGLSASEKLDRTEARVREVASMIDGAMAVRSMLPRRDKQEAHRMLGEIAGLQKRLGWARDRAREFRAEAERQDRHAMWAQAVNAVAGPEVLAQCLAWMRSERKRRKQPPISNDFVAPGCELFSEEA